MTIRLHWPSQASKGLTAIEIYRKVGWDATLDANNPGTPVATLAGTATEYVENVANLTPKTIYKYWIAAVKGTERLIGGPVTQAFYLDTGPGPQTILRGDWKSGYFGTVTKQDFFSTPELKMLLPTNQGNLFSYDPDFWYKFVYKGRIIFIPNTRHGYDRFYTVYTAGMAYGADDAGKVIPKGYSPVKQDAKVSKDGRSYRIRLPYCLDYDTTVFTSYDSANGEWGNTWSRLYRGGPADMALAGRGTFDGLATLAGGSGANDVGSALMVPLYSVEYPYYSYANGPWNFSTTGIGTVASLYFVFELILP